MKGELGEHSRVADVGHSDEDFKGVLLIGFTNAAFDITLYSGFPLLAMTMAGDEHQ